MQPESCTFLQPFLLRKKKKQGEGGDEDEATMMEVEGATEMDGSLMEGEGNTMTSLDGKLSNKPSFSTC